MYLYCGENFNMVQVPKTGTRENLTLKAGHPPAGIYFFQSSSNLIAVVDSMSFFCFVWLDFDSLQDLFYLLADHSRCILIKKSLLLLNMRFKNRTTVPKATHPCISVPFTYATCMAWIDLFPYSLPVDILFCILRFQVFRVSNFCLIWYFLERERTLCAQTAHRAFFFFCIVFFLFVFIWRSNKIILLRVLKTFFCSPLQTAINTALWLFIVKVLILHRCFVTNTLGNSARVPSELN